MKSRWIYVYSNHYLMVIMMIINFKVRESVDIYYNNNKIFYVVYYLYILFKHLNVCILFLVMIIRIIPGKIINMVKKKFKFFVLFFSLIPIA